METYNGAMEEENRDYLNEDFTHTFEKEGITATELDEQRLNLMKENKQKRWREVRQTSDYESGNFKEQSENIQKIMEELKSIVAPKKTALAVSIIALVISIGTMAFFVLRFYFL